jgi:type I restriction enzyme S subunit
MKIIPELRFPEFENDGEWVAKKFQELFEIGNGKDYKHLEGGDIPVYGSGGYMLSVNEYLYDGESVCIGRKGTIDKPMFLSDKFWTVDTLFYTYKFKDCLPKFIFYVFLNINWLNHNEAGGVPSLSKRNIYKIETAVPPQLQEQQKIASCLSSLDELIAAHSQKLDLLKDHKKGLMQNLFPNPSSGSGGESVPKYRFPEFENDGEWVEKKLGEVAELTSSKRVHLADYVSSGVPFFRGKEISQLKNNQFPDDILYISNEQYKEIKDKYGVPKRGDILITAVGTLGNVYCIKNDDKFYFKDGNLIWMKNIAIYSHFLEVLLDVEKGKVLASAIGSSQKALTMAALNKLAFQIPENPREQQKIASCLSAVDELITAQAERIAQLQQHKKGLMQGLFPKMEG